MTYVELIVVLSIFAIMSSIVMFNYGAFQAKVDIKVLANDIALQIVQAQKDAMNGKININALTIDPNWKPSYGVYFDKNNSNNKNFIYYANFHNMNGQYQVDNNCGNEGSECISDIKITKDNYVSNLQIFPENGQDYSDLSINFTRPNSGANFYTSTNGDEMLHNVSFAQITIISSQSPTAKACIQVYSSGKVQIGTCQ